MLLFSKVALTLFVNGPMSQLKLVTTKCQYMRVGLRRTDASRYSLNGVDLNKINSCSDLGVKFDSVLSFASY